MSVHYPAGGREAVRTRLRSHGAAKLPEQYPVRWARLTSGARHGGENPTDDL